LSAFGRTVSVSCDRSHEIIDKMIHNTIKKIKNLRMTIYIAKANHVCIMIFFNSCCLYQTGIAILSDHNRSISYKTRGGTHPIED
jgi:hypothetical protein